MTKIISEAIYGIKFKGIEKLNCTKLVAFISESDKWYHNLRLRKIFPRLLAKIVLNRYKYVTKEEKGDKVILFAYNEPLYRKDVYAMMLNIFSCADNASFIQYEKNVSPCGLQASLKRLSLAIQWYGQMKETGLTIKQKVVVVDTLLDAIIKCDLVKPYLNYKALVVRYDAFLDNAVSQFFKINGRLTITAQHGVMCATREVPHYGIWFRAFVSHYFMAWDEMTKKEAIKDGLKEHEVVVCGNPKCIDSVPCKKCCNHIMGVLLDGYDFINQGLIDIANAYCKKNRYNYILRYHPNYKGNEYDAKVNPSYYLKTERNSLAEYAESVEFTLMGNSTALLELLYMKHPCYVYTTDSDVEVYKGLIPQFHNIDELEFLLKDNNYLEDVKKTLVTVKDARKGYTDFFNHINDILK